MENEIIKNEFNGLNLESHSSKSSFSFPNIEMPLKIEYFKAIKGGKCDDLVGNGAQSISTTHHSI